MLRMVDSHIDLLGEFMDSSLWTPANLDFSSPRDPELVNLRDGANADGGLPSESLDFPLLFPFETNDLDGELLAFDELPTAEGGEVAIDLLRENEPQTPQELPALNQAQGGLETRPGNDSSTNATQLGRTRRVNPRGPSAMHWSSQKANILRLYIDEDNTLEATKKTMKDQFDFNATSVS